MLARHAVLVDNQGMQDIHSYTIDIRVETQFVSEALSTPRPHHHHGRR